MATTAATATWAKLPSGSWGLSVTSATSPMGVVVIARKKDGATSTHRVVRTVEQKGDRWLCEQAPATAVRNVASAPVTRSAPRSEGCCRGCRGPVVDAARHRAMEGYCGACAFDEFDL